MSVMQLTGSTAGAPSSQRKKPKRALRGLRRKSIQKLLHYCNVVLGQDRREGDMAENKGYTPLLFTVRPGNANEKALSTVATRCRNLLDAVLE